MMVARDGAVVLHIGVHNDRDASLKMAKVLRTHPEVVHVQESGDSWDEWGHQPTERSPYQHIAATVLGPDVKTALHTATSLGALYGHVASTGTDPVTWVVTDQVDWSVLFADSSLVPSHARGDLNSAWEQFMMGLVDVQEWLSGIWCRVAGHRYRVAQFAFGDVDAFCARCGEPNPSA